MKERHDRVLYLLVRAVLKALGLPIPGYYKPGGGQARPGVHGTPSIGPKLPNRLSSGVQQARNSCPPGGGKRLVILEVAYAWEPAILGRETEKKLRYQETWPDRILDTG